MPALSFSRHRRFAIAPLLFLAACGGGADDNAAAPAEQPTVAAQGTPVENVTVALGNEESWMEPREDAGDPKQAPYGNLLDQPLVDAPHKR